MTDYPTFDRPRRKKRKATGAALAAGGVAVFIWSLGFAIWLKAGEAEGTSNLAVKIATGVGLGFAGALAGAVVVAVVLWLVHGRDDRRKALTRFGVLAMVALVGSVPASGLKAVGTGLANEQRAVDEARAKIEHRKEAFLTRVHDEREAIIADGFMEPAVLHRPGGIGRARRQVEALRALTRRAQAENEQLARQARAEIEALPASSARRTAMLAAFDRGVAGSRTEAEEELKLTMTLFDEIDGQLDILARTPRAWAPQYGSIGFERASDMNAFNARASRIRDLDQLLQAMAHRREARAADQAAGY